MMTKIEKKNHPNKINWKQKTAYQDNTLFVYTLDRIFADSRSHNLWLILFL